MFTLCKIFPLKKRIFVLITPKLGNVHELQRLRGLGLGLLLPRFLSRKGSYYCLYLTI